MRNKKVIASIDIETTSLRPENGRIRCIQLAWDGGELFMDVNKSSQADIIRRLKTFSDGGALVAFNAGFEHHWIKHHYNLTLDLVDVVHYRMATVGGGIYSLENIIKWDFNHQLSKDIRSMNWDIEQLSDEQIEYAMEDARWTWKLYKKYQDAPAWIFTNAVDGVRNMDSAGITLDVDKHVAFVKRTERSRDYIESRLCATADINWRSGKQVGEFAKEILPKYFIRRWPRTATGLLCMDAETVKSMAHTLDYPFSRLFAAKQVYSKRSTYLSLFGESLIDKTDCDSRVHPQYIIGGASTGRFACRKPNIQQMPRALWFRDMFVAPAGKKFVVADYSQIELRIVAEMSQDSRMQESFDRGDDIHDTVAISIFGKSFTKEERHFAKGVSFGILYGQGSESLGNRIGVSTSDADDYICKWLDSYPDIRRWRRTLDRRNALTIVGRKIKIPYDKKMTASYNYPIQGSAADLMLQAIYCVHSRLPSYVDMIATVHDELILECPDNTVSATKYALEYGMKQAWSNLFSSSNESVVDVGVGDTWAIAKM